MFFKIFIWTRLNPQKPFKSIWACWSHQFFIAFKLNPGIYNFFIRQNCFWPEHSLESYWNFIVLSSKKWLTPKFEIFIFFIQSDTLYPTRFIYTDLVFSNPTKFSNIESEVIWQTSFKQKMIDSSIWNFLFCLIWYSKSDLPSSIPTWFSDPTKFSIIEPELP